MADTRHTSTTTSDSLHLSTLPTIGGNVVRKAWERNKNNICLIITEKTHRMSKICKFISYIYTATTETQTQSIYFIIGCWPIITKTCISITRSTLLILLHVTCTSIKRA